MGEEETLQQKSKLWKWGEKSRVKITCTLHNLSQCIEQKISFLPPHQFPNKYSQDKHNHLHLPTCFLCTTSCAHELPHALGAAAKKDIRDCTCNVTVGKEERKRRKWLVQHYMAQNWRCSKQIQLEAFDYTVPLFSHFTRNGRETDGGFWNSKFKPQMQTCSASCLAQENLTFTRMSP